MSLLSSKQKKWCQLVASGQLPATATEKVFGLSVVDAAAESKRLLDDKSLQQYIEALEHVRTQRGALSKAKRMEIASEIADNIEAADPHRLKAINILNDMVGDLPGGEGGGKQAQAQAVTVNVTIKGKNES